jgi:dTDP-4-amino-4,6-dideoxygalactose transaminase
MINLIPTELWEYTLNDFVTAMITAGKMKKNPPSLHIPGLGDCIPVRSGRVALLLAIRALKLPPKARIGVPLYCCPVVFKAIEAANCTHCFIDIDPSNGCISPDDVQRKRDQIDALVAVHMFGNTCDINALKHASKGKPIIEDCAQSVGSKINGQLTGNFGDISFFSFRSGKYISVGEGGVLFTKNQELLVEITKMVQELPIPNRRDEMKHAVMTYIRSKLRSKPLYGLIGHHIWAIYNKKVDPAIQAPIVLKQVFKTDQTLALKRLSLVHLFVKKQRANADYYSKHLNKSQDIVFTEKQGTYYNRYLYPLKLYSPTIKNSITQFLFEHQVGAIQPYKDIVEYATRQYGYKGGCPVSEQTAKTILAIPNHYHLTDKEKEHIVRTVNKGLAMAGIQ